jgi:hypothetical protein
MEMVLDVYKLPYDKYFPVVCMDESPKQLIKQTKMPLKIRPEYIEKEDYEYERCGVIQIFIANESLRGKRYVKVTDRKTKKDWALFIKEIADDHYPNAKKIKLVMDNLNTQEPSALSETFEPTEAKRLWDRFEFIYTPKHGSWLNMAEIDLIVLMGQCLNRKIDKKEIVEQEVKAWNIDRNNKESKISWQFTNEKARIKLKKLYPTILS